MTGDRRAQFMERVAQLSSGSKWATSANPVKQRIGQLEIAWREGLQGVMEDIRSMFLNFQTMGDAYDTVDVNVASIKSLLIDKGVFTEAEFQERQAFLFKVLDAERVRRQVELEAKRAATPSGLGAPTNGGAVDADLVRMRNEAAATTDADHVPPQASIFGGGRG